MNDTELHSHISNGVYGFAGEKKKKKAKGIHQYFWYVKHREVIGMERQDVLTNIIWDLNL